MVGREIGEVVAAGIAEVVGKLALDGSELLTLARQRRGRDRQLVGDLLAPGGELRLPGLGGQEARLVIRRGPSQRCETLELGLRGDQLCLEGREVAVGGGPGGLELGGELAHAEVMGVAGRLGVIDLLTGGLLGPGVRSASVRAGGPGVVGGSAHRTVVADDECAGELGGDAADARLLDVEPRLLELLGVVDGLPVQISGLGQLSGETDRQPCGLLPLAQSADLVADAG